MCKIDFGMFGSSKVELILASELIILEARNCSFLILKLIFILKFIVQLTFT